jgi:hypothetical protein
MEATCTRTRVHPKQIAIVQSNYIPWKGYFDLVRSVDEFILYDDVQYTRRDWRNRNRIKTRAGVHWLTIPVQVKGTYFQRIRDTKVADPGWGQDHWETIRHNYSRAPYFRAVAEMLEPLYLGRPDTWLSEVNRRFLVAISEFLGISTRFSSSSDYAPSDGKSERLIDLCRQAGAVQYLSGPAARAYIDESLFEQSGIRVRYADYAGYEEYPQFFPPFEHSVSIVDLLFHTGTDAVRYMRSL